MKMIGLLAVLAAGLILNNAYAVMNEGGMEQSKTVEVPKSIKTCQTMMQKGQLMADIGTQMIDKGQKANDQEMISIGKKLMIDGKLITDEGKFMLDKNQSIPGDQWAAYGKMMNEDGKLILDKGQALNDQEMIDNGKLLIEKSEDIEKTCEDTK